MKKIAAFVSGITYFVTTLPVYAQAAPTHSPGKPDDIKIKPPGIGLPAGTELSTILNNVLIIIFSAAVLLVLFMLIIGAFTWITSAGDKEKVAGARNRIIHALVGLAILALAFVILRVVGDLIHVNFLDLKLPALDAK